MTEGKKQLSPAQVIDRININNNYHHHLINCNMTKFLVK